MTDSNATELLRKLLDERGVEYDTRDGKAVKNTYWWSVGDLRFGYCEQIYEDGQRETDLFMYRGYGCTPEQAVAATLGAGECENEKLRGQIETLVAYVESDGTKYYVDDEGNQHFDHAATLGAEAIEAWNTRYERTCENACEYRDEIQAKYDKAIAAMNKAAGNWAKADAEIRELRKVVGE